NAIKYTYSGGITISVISYEMFVRIDITDTGIGISENDQTKIFSRFCRLENTREQEGVGIGLYLAREIISGQNGYIKVVSKPGEGATFSVFLPKQQ
ncbi:MAG: sensor histidine kinase, partial [Coprococcus sp.]